MLRQGASGARFLLEDEESLKRGQRTGVSLVPIARLPFLSQLLIHYFFLFFLCFDSSTHLVAFMPHTRKVVSKRRMVTPTIGNDGRAVVPSGSSSRPRTGQDGEGRARRDPGEERSVVAGSGRGEASRERAVGGRGQQRGEWQDPGRVGASTGQSRATGRSRAADLVPFRLGLPGYPMCTGALK